MMGPEIRIEMSGLKSTVIKMFSDHSEAIRDEISKAIDSFPLEEEIQRQTKEVLTVAIRRAVEAASYAVVEELRPRLAESMLAAARKAMRRDK